MRRPAAVCVVGPVQWVVYPALAVIVLTVLLATPIRIFGLRLPEPVLPMVLAFAWPLIRPSMVGPLVLFGLGLFLDLLWGGTMGLWPICLLAVYGVVLTARNFLAGQQTAIQFLLYAGCTVLAFVLAYLIVTMTSGTAPNVWPLLAQWVQTLILFPAAFWLIERFDDGDTRFR